jgi:hypothetical protein
MSAWAILFANRVKRYSHLIWPFLLAVVSRAFGFSGHTGEAGNWAGTGSRQGRLRDLLGGESSLREFVRQYEPRALQKLLTSWVARRVRRERVDSGLVAPRRRLSQL